MQTMEVLVAHLVLEALEVSADFLILIVRFLVMEVHPLLLAQQFMKNNVTQ